MFIRLLISLTFIISVTACTPLPQQNEITLSFQTGDLNTADQILSETLYEEMPQNNYWNSQNAVCLLLDRATTRFIKGDIDLAISDYQLAIEALDFYGQDCTLETAGKVVFADTFGAYCGSANEHILARVYFALALLQKGDSNNALALLKQAEDLQQRLNSLKQPYLSAIYRYDNALAKFLLALLLEQKGDKTNAAILFQQANSLTESSIPDCSLTDTISTATVVLLCHNGNVPFKLSGTCPASIASAVALECLLSAQNLPPAYSSFTGIPVPVLCQYPYSLPLPTTSQIERHSLPLTPIVNVAETTYRELENKKPLIVARGVARFLMRRTAVGYAQEQDPSLGALVDFGLFIANLNTKADTRAWTTLPSSLDIAVYHIPPGVHDVRISVQRPFNRIYEKTFPITIKDHDICVIDIFNIHPEITKIIVPSRFNP